MLLFVINLFVLSVVQASGVAPTRVLNDGNQIPLVSMGTFGQIKDPLKFTQATIWALEAGYRLIDTAAFYLNEKNVGDGIAAAINRGIVTREEIFVTTKLDVRVSTGDGVVNSIKSSLSRLNLDYVDLYLIHSPTNAYNLSETNDPVNVWKGMEEAKKLGLTKSIGVSNFDGSLIDLILANGEIPPAVNEVEINPTYTNVDIVSYCHERNITVIGYASMGLTVPRPFRPDIDALPSPSLEDPVLTGIANKYGVSTSQVILRNSIDRGIIPIVKSFTRERIIRNFDLFGFKLTAEEVSQITKFNQDEKIYLFDKDTLNNMCLYIYNLNFEGILEFLNTY